MATEITLPSIIGSPIVEYRALDGFPAPRMVTIQRRHFTHQGGQFMGDASDWKTLPIAEIKHQIRLDGPVAQWLRSEARVDCTAERISSYPDDSQPAYLWCIDAGR